MDATYIVPVLAFATLLIVFFLVFRAKRDAGDRIDDPGAPTQARPREKDSGDKSAKT